jgi:hypothetical protein
MPQRSSIPTEAMQKMATLDQQFRTSLTPEQRKKQDSIQQKYSTKMRALFSDNTSVSFYKQMQERREKAMEAILTPTQRQKQSELKTLRAKQESLQRDTYSNFNMTPEMSKKQEALQKKLREEQQVMYKRQEQERQQFAKRQREASFALYPPEKQKKMREFFNIQDQIGQLESDMSRTLTAAQRTKQMQIEQQLSKEQQSVTQKQQELARTAMEKRDKAMREIANQQMQEMMPSLNAKQQQMLKEMKALSEKIQQEQKAQNGAASQINKTMHR